MKDYEKPWMDVIEIGYIDTIENSCMDDYDCDTEGGSAPVCVSGLPD